MLVVVEKIGTQDLSNNVLRPSTQDAAQQAGTCFQDAAYAPVHTYTYMQMRKHIHIHIHMHTCVGMHNMCILICIHMYKCTYDYFL